MSDCLGKNDLERFHTGEASKDDRSRFELHLKRCAECAERNATFMREHEELIEHLRTVSTSTVEGPQQQPCTNSPGTAGGSCQDETPTGPDDHRAPVLIRGYEIIKELGRGGMGVVYEAVQVKLNRRVALKVLTVMSGSADRDAVTRFRREATAAAKLHHTHIVPVYDCGETGNAFYYAMELIEGQSLTEMIRHFARIDAPSASRTALAEVIGVPLLDAPDSGGEAEGDDATGSDASGVGTDATSRGRFYYRQVAQWMGDAADALHHAHSEGIIHRDIKPGNLFLTRQGRIMLLDFGLAKSASDLSVTRTGSLVGTLRYMSPEQAMAKRMNVDHRTDIYSLGATMYEMLTFQPAFKGRDEKETLGLIVTRDPTLPRKIIPQVPRELQTICLKSLEKDPDARYATAKDLAEDLRRYNLDLPIVARPVGPVGRAIKFVRRRRAATVAACSLVFLVLAVTFAVTYARKAHDEAIRASDEKISSLVSQGVGHWRDHDWAQAERAFNEILEIDPDNFTALANLASMKRAQYDEQQIDSLLVEASELLERAMLAEPENARGWNIKGVYLRMEGHVPEAIEAHKQGIAIDENFYANWVSLAGAYAVSGNLLDAERCLLEASQFADGAADFMPWHNLAAVQLAMEKPEALAALHKAVETSKKTSQRRAAKLLEAKLRLRLAEGVDPKKALAAAITAHGLTEPGQSNPRILRVLALAYLRNESWQDAVEAAEQALDLDSQDAYTRLILAIAGAHLGNTDAAREHLGGGIATWPAELQAAGVVATADAGLLWFETAAELAQLREEAERLVAPDTP